MLGSPGAEDMKVGGAEELRCREAEDLCTTASQENVRDCGHKKTRSEKGKG